MLLRSRCVRLRRRIRGALLSFVCVCWPSLMRRLAVSCASERGRIISSIDSIPTKGIPHRRTHWSPVHSRQDLTAAVGGFGAQRWQCAAIGGKGNGNRSNISPSDHGWPHVTSHIVAALPTESEDRRSARKGRRGCGSCQYAAVVTLTLPSIPKRAVAVQQAVNAVICRCASSEPMAAGCRQEPGRSEIEWKECAKGGAVAAFEWTCAVWAGHLRATTHMYLSIPLWSSHTTRDGTVRKISLGEYLPSQRRVTTQC
jgi:hypothetical protein